ncbi:MAG: sulfotransferase [Caulobacterales bacterium]|jgi:Tfp pilus assembly protein PilF|nr:sulfotransferase [Caulobacterales bacterium]
MTGPDHETRRLVQATAQAFSQGDRAAAANFARAVLARAPLEPNANQILGIVALEAGDPNVARAHLLRADASAPNQPQILNTLGVALRRCGDIAGARDRFRRAGELGLIDGWRNLGNLEEIERNTDASVAAYRKAVRIAANDPASHAALARAAELRHDLAGAKLHAETALRGDPGNETARLALAQVLIRERDFAGAEAAATPITANPRALQTNRALAWGLIGEARDRGDDARGAFAAFTQSNAILLEQNAALLSASHLLYHPEGVARMQALVAQTDVAAWRVAGPSATPAPVFLVGFPRSGTTLLDQILSSHSSIVCIEEREHFANALASVISDQEKLAHFADLSDAEIERARAEFWRRVDEDGVDRAGKLVIDKLPLNIVVLPLIKRVFPEAKIIFALRDPRDVILSCYQQRFGMNAAMAQFLELNSAAAYYDAIMRLMQLCEERLALDRHRIRYEDVVADVEGAARALTQFLGVAFEPSMLDFRSTALKRDINTPSARQVIEPLYKRSIQRWRRYAQDLAPALPILNAWAARFGYTAD